MGLKGRILSLVFIIVAEAIISAPAALVVAVFDAIPGIAVSVVYNSSNNRAWTSMVTNVHPLKDEGHKSS